MSLFLNSLYTIDYILIILICLFVFFSIWKGFIQSILGLMAWVGSIVITLIFYSQLSYYFSNQLNKINFIEAIGLSEILSIIISIPLIFIISLIILRKFRKILSSDLDKATLGIILDKFFGIIYGFFFSYFIFTLILIVIEQINIDLIYFLINNSFILGNIDIFNEFYIYKHIPFLIEETSQVIN